MSETNNYHFYKPLAGESGWAEQMNNNLDQIDNIIKSVSENITAHVNTGTGKHTAGQIAFGVGSNVETALNNLSSDKANTSHTHSASQVSYGSNSNVETMLSSLSSGKANTSHNHPDYALNSDLETISNTLDLLLPDLTEIEVSASIQNRSGGIRIINSTSPIIHISEWKILVEKNGSIVCELTSTSNHIMVSNASLEGVSSGDLLNITVKAVSGNSLKSKKYSHTYIYVNSDFEERLYRMEEQLTLGNFIDAFAQDADALQALANVLHSSNTLAQKVAELK